MATFVIPTANRVPHFDQETTLDGERFILTFHWNAVMSSWFVSIADVDQVPIVEGRRLSAGWAPLLRSADPRRPQGEILVIDTTGEGIDPGFEDLGERVILTYLEAADVEALES